MVFFTIIHSEAKNFSKALKLMNIIKTNFFIVLDNLGHGRWRKTWKFTSIYLDTQNFLNDADSPDREKYDKKLADQTEIANIETVFNYIA